MTKRRKFIIGALLLSIGLMALQFIPLEYRFVGVFAFFLVTYLVSAWVLFDDLKGIEWVTILSLPSLYAVAMSLFYFLLPSNTISRLIILTLFGIGLYAIYLTENIYSVAAIRTIQLLRAAHAVGFLMSVLVLVLLYNTIYSLRWPFWANGLLVAVVSFPILLQGLWSVKLESRISKEVVVMSVGTTVLLLELAVILSFLPVTVWVASLFLATVAYVVLGLLQHALDERLFSRTLYEYVGVGIFVLVATLLVTSWK